MVKQSGARTRHHHIGLPGDRSASCRTEGHVAVRVIRNSYVTLISLRFTRTESRPDRRSKLGSAGPTRGTVPSLGTAMHSLLHRLQSKLPTASGALDDASKTTSSTGRAQRARPQPLALSWTRRGCSRTRHRRRAPRGDWRSSRGPTGQSDTIAVAATGGEATQPVHASSFAGDQECRSATGTATRASDAVGERRRVDRDSPAFDGSRSRDVPRIPSPIHAPRRRAVPLRGGT